MGNNIDPGFMKGIAKSFNNFTAGMSMLLGTPEAIIKDVYVNKEERLVVVKWVDDSITKVKCSPDDDFDIYVGVALAYTYKKAASKTKFKQAVDSHIHFM